jgi:O-antigen/teichoic acid export membrane protein
MFATLRNRVLHLSSLVSLEPFAVDTAEGRGRERHRRMLLSAMAALSAKAISLSTTLISVPLTLKYLGPERYGMWITMSSAIAMLSFADLGIGNGVLNAVADAHGREDQHGIRETVSSGFFVLSAIAALLVAAFFIGYPFIAWDRVFNVTSPLARQEAGSAIGVFAVCFAINIPLGIVQRVQTGLQQGFSASLWQCAGSAAGLAGVLLVIAIEGSLTALILAMIGAPLLAALGNTLVFFLGARKDLAPRISTVKRASIVRLGKTGSLFLVLQIAMSVAFISDAIVIAHFISASAVSEYSVPEKMFSTVSLLIGMMLAPLWPAYGEAIARGDTKWVYHTLKRSMVIALSVTACSSLLLVTFGHGLLEAWVGDSVNPPFALLAALGVWKVLEVGGSTFSHFLNGANLLRTQAILAVAMATSAILLKVFLIPLLGIVGVVVGTIISYVAFVALPWLLLTPGVLSRMTRESKH